MTEPAQSSHVVTPPRAPQLIMLALGLCLTALWAWRAGFIWRPSPLSSPPQTKIFIDLKGDLPRAGLHVFPIPLTVQEAWQAAGGEGILSDPNQLLSSGARMIVAPDRSVALERMSGRELLTLGLAIDLNLSTAADLEAVPGIGPVLAERIVAYRAAQGPFQDIESLQQVKGLGPKLLEKIRPYVVIIPYRMEGRDE